MRHEQGMSNHGLNRHDDKEPAGATEMKCKEMEYYLVFEIGAAKNTVVLIINALITTPPL